MQVMFAVVVSALLLAACGEEGSGDGGAAPAPRVILLSIAVTPQNQSAVLNSVLQLAAIGTYSNSKTRDITTSVTWSSGNTAVATVNANTGLVTPARGASAGQTAVITATNGVLTPATTTVWLSGATFSPSTIIDPQALQQRGLGNSPKSDFAEVSGVTNNTGSMIGTVLPH